jgi:hypothetical protein
VLFGLNQTALYVIILLNTRENMGYRISLIGQRFGKLIVESHNSVKSLSGGTRWNCICDCGNKTTIASGNLTTGNSTSCGCVRSKLLSERMSTHGMTGSPEHDIWRAMLSRCSNPNVINYERYGGRNITVCDRWLNSFENFYSDMGTRPSPEHSIERKENDKGYEPGNCYWATKAEQANNKRNNVFYEYRGKKYSAKELLQLPQALDNGINKHTFNSRIRQYGYSVQEAIEEPIAKRCTL